MSKKLIILTGPQGSGNHLWSKIFALHPEVFGWRDLLKEYWIPHAEEPFAKYWQDPKLLKDFNWKQSNYFVTSISCPFVYNKAIHIPNYKDFYFYANKYADIKYCIISRDINILKLQQKRVRNTVTVDNFSLKIVDDKDHIFLSTECLYQYNKDYLKTLSNQLSFPIDFASDKINNILIKNPNKKYIKQAKPTKLDDYVKKVSLY